MSKREEKETQITAESQLSPQIGTDPTLMAEGQFDHRLFSKLHPLDPIWMSYFLNKPDKKGGRFCRKFIRNILALKRSEDGWGFNKTIQFVAATKGVAGSAGEIIKRPSWLARQTTQRDWRKKAEEKGGVIIE